MSLGVAFALSAPAGGAERYTAVIVKVIDGDTLRVDVAGWPRPFRPANIRVFGIDAPESLRRNARCEIEQVRGRFVTSYVRELLPKGSAVRLEMISSHEKYGRLLMRVFLANGRNLGAHLLAQRLAVPYRGSRKRYDWCRLGR